MGRIGDRMLGGIALVLIASCSAAPPKPQRTTPQARAPLAPSQAAAASPPQVPLREDLYTAKLVYLLARGWRPPTELEVAPMSLKTTAEVDVDQYGALVGFRLAQSSGSAPFDSSVTGHLQRLIDAGARAESGAPYIVDHLFGETLTVRFSGPPPEGVPVD